MISEFWPRRVTKMIRPADYTARAPIGTLRVSLADRFLCLFVANQMPWIATLSVRFRVIRG